ncbi:beta-lactamase family protein [Kitasatospora sp. NBC_01287]|uniref:serine hydrolase domain-containing protein n=1 Tax=Kitasatospora sp. NBC_01287 TaxID=2903573 RepID=UPI00225A17A3|nr:serine hydrolase domain-containing protein [Kitasatospora sp. NBC_01287]MCX4744544.1 beta-lactamase family protein [Kitasatospora sp. NBC_01287]
MSATTDRIRHIRRLIADGADEQQVYPGAVWAVGDAAGTLAGGAVGLLDPAVPQVPMRPDTLFDLASLTKILAVWSTLGTLWETGRLVLDEPLGAHWPEVAGRPLGRITAGQLLTHTAGLPLHARLRECFGTDPAAIRAGVLAAAPHRPPGEAVEYTDRAGLVLGYLAEYRTGRPLDELAAERIWRPLGMRATRFGPLPAELTTRCAPTEADPATGAPFRGVVHDPSARLLGGICGIAGVFSTAEDLALFLRHLLDPAARPGPPYKPGRSDGAHGAGPGFGAAWTAQSLTVRTGSLEPARGLFWQVAPRSDPAADIWVHYGFTGTGMWLSPRLGRWAVLLTNRVRLSRESQPLTDLRDAFRALAFG